MNEAEWTHALSFNKKNVQPRLLSSNTSPSLSKSQFWDSSLQKGKLFNNREQVELLEIMSANAGTFM